MAALPTAGNTLTMDNINSTVSQAAGSFMDMEWLRNNTKEAATDLGTIAGYNWFQLNGAKTSTATSNCSNCVGAQCRDARVWLQANCNCNCTGNCNCNCNCRC